LFQKMSTASLYPFPGVPSADIRRRRKTKWYLRVRFPNCKKTARRQRHWSIKMPRQEPSRGKGNRLSRNAGAWMAQGAETRQQAAQAPLPFFVAAFRRHPGTTSAFRRFCTPLRQRLGDVGHARPPEKPWHRQPPGKGRWTMKKMLIITTFGLFLAADLPSRG